MVKILKGLVPLRHCGAKPAGIAQAGGKQQLLGNSRMQLFVTVD
jgi:hypothetical protein